MAYKKFLVVIKAGSGDVRTGNGGNLQMEMISSFGRANARLKAEHDVLIFDDEIIAVFDETEIEMMTHIYYKAYEGKACAWLKHLIRLASVNSIAFHELTDDSTSNEDEHVLNVVKEIIHYHQFNKRRNPETLHEVYPEYIIETELDEMEIVEDA